MVSHGIKLDLEFAAIVAGALAASYFISGKLVSNSLFSALIVSLFFLMGLHVDRAKFRRNLHNTREVGLGLLLVYLAVPLLAFAFSTAFDGNLGDALVAIGASTAAIGSPTVFSNIGRGEDGTALMVSVSSVIVGVFAVPLLVYFMGVRVPVGSFAVKNFALIGLPLGMGMVLQRYENRVLEDIKVHFSKLALWLLVLIFGVQVKLSLGSSLFSASELVIGVPVLATFVIASYVLGHVFARLAGISEPQSRSIGFVSGSKGIAVALFVAAQISGGALVFVSMYYFIRQLILGTLAEAYSKHMERDFEMVAIPDWLKDWHL